MSDHEGLVLGLVTAAGLFLGIGALWPASDRDGRFWRALRISGSVRTASTPRDAIYGFIPAGLACLVVAAGVVAGRRAHVVMLVVACGLGYLAVWLALHPPERLKPRWVVDAESSGRRSARMDRWDRNLCYAAAFGITVILVAYGSLLLAGSVPAAR